MCCQCSPDGNVQCDCYPAQRLGGEVSLGGRFAARSAGDWPRHVRYSVDMSGDKEVSSRRRVTDFLGLTDSPRIRAKIIANSTPTELLIRALVASAFVVIFTVVIFVERDRGFVWFLIADLGFACAAAFSWVRWVRYRKL